MSAWAASSSLGETNVRWPSVIDTLGSGRALPHRPTICACNLPPSSRNSSHDGYSRSRALSVKSQRPRNAFTESSAFAAGDLSEFHSWEIADAHKTRVTRVGRNTIFGSFIGMRLSPLNHSGRG